MDREWIKIPDVLFFQEGPGVRNTQYTTEGVKLLNVANLVGGKVDLSTSERYISNEEAYGKYKHFLCDEGDFIVASSGIKVEYIDKKMGFIDKSMLPLCMNTSTIRFKVLNPEQLRIRYFMYYLKSQHFKGQLAKLITGSAQLNYGPSHLKQMIMPLNTIDGQDDIVEKLDKIQAIIDLRKREIEKLDELIKSQFFEMFGDPFTNPMGWQIGTLGDYIIVLTDFSSNGSYKTLDSNVVMKDEPDYAWMVRTTDLETGEESSYKYIDEWTWNFLEKSKIYGDEIIMCKIGSAGKIYLMPNTGKPASLGRNAFMFRFNDLIDRVYLYYLLTTDYGTKEIMQYVRGAVTKTITKDDVRRVRIIVPPIEKQKEFVNFIEQVNKSKAAVQKGLDETQKLFDSLMQQYFG